VIRGRVANVVECFTCSSDDVRLANFERECRFDVDGKVLGRATEYSLSDLSPLRANWDFGADSSNPVGSIWLPGRLVIRDQFGQPAFSLSPVRRLRLRGPGI
jgi:hypothetical protein